MTKPTNDWSGKGNAVLGARGWLGLRSLPNPPGRVIAEVRGPNRLSPCQCLLLGSPDSPLRTQCAASLDLVSKFVSYLLASRSSWRAFTKFSLLRSLLCMAATSLVPSIASESSNAFLCLGGLSIRMPWPFNVVFSFCLSISHSYAYRSHRISHRNIVFILLQLQRSWSPS